jgi:hypothetical protein
MTQKLLDFEGVFLLFVYLASDCQKIVKIMKLAMHWKILIGMIVGLPFDYNEKDLLKTETILTAVCCSKWRNEKANTKLFRGCCRKWRRAGSFQPLIDIVPDNFLKAFGGGRKVLCIGYFNWRKRCWIFV